MTGFSSTQDFVSISTEKIETADFVNTLCQTSVVGILQEDVQIPK
jgi:hypothetical protein